MYKRVLTVVYPLCTLLFSCSIENKIQGNWIRSKPEKTATGSFSIREFSIGKQDWEIQFTVYLDSTIQRPVFTFRGVGKYEIGKSSATVITAMEAVFHFDKKYVTLKTNDTALIRKFGLGNCNLIPGMEKDITETGCSYLTSKTVCTQEFDLITSSGRKLYLVARSVSGGICEESKRP